MEEFLKAGNDILNSVSSAIDRNDYSTLHQDVARVVKSVSVERKTTYSSQRLQQGQSQQSQQQPEQGQQPIRGRYAPKIYPFLQKRIGRYQGVPQAAAALPVGGFFLLLTIGMFVSGSMIGGIITGLITAGCGWLFADGLRKYDLAKKFYEYGNILKDAEYFNIKDLAKAALKKDKEVLKDIKAMIKRGFLPRAKLDSTENVCMITDKAYEQYLGAEKDREAREDREKNARENAAKEAKQRNAEYKNLPAKAVQILEEGREYITFVRDINDKIPDTEEMSNKLYRLEEIMNRIFAQVKKDPSSADELHKFMDYYLPTTKKLLNAYVELDKQPQVGDNITQTKNEIDGAMDTINQAFESLLDSLFQDMAWDISSDISVMKTMMAQDGLQVGAQGQFAQQGQAQTQNQTQTQPQLKF